MKQKAIDIFIKVLGFVGSIFLTIMAGVLAMLSLFALVMSVVDKEFVSIIGCIGAGVAAWILWSIRKDTLV